MDKKLLETLIGLAAAACLGWYLSTWWHAPLSWADAQKAGWTVTVVDPEGRTCEVQNDPQGRKPLAAILGCPPARKKGE